jgi:formylglycine-generating enzyme required for sulfatase activity
MKKSVFILLFAALGLSLSAQADTDSPTTSELILVPSGSYQRDSNKANINTIDSFYINKYEVTQDQFIKISKLSNPSKNKKDQINPVENITFYEAIVFCNKLSITENLEPVYMLNNSTNPDDWGKVPKKSDTTWNMVTINWNASGYRIPTKAEWVWAALGANDTNRRFFSGSSIASVQDTAWYIDNAGNKTHPIGLMKPNDLGIYDMSGNVYEMCIEGKNTLKDGIVNNPYKDNYSITPMGMIGGAFDSKIAQLNLQIMIPYWAYDRYPFLGFRVVRNAENKLQPKNK